jgi:hypothetical protein
MTIFGGNCSKCGKGSPRLGGHYGPNAFCRCIEKSRTSTPRTPRHNPVVESSTLSIAEQLALLLDLRLQGALTEEEFTMLKSRLISGEN